MIPLIKQLSKLMQTSFSAEAETTRGASEENVYVEDNDDRNDNTHASWSAEVQANLGWASRPLSTAS